MKDKSAMIVEIFGKNYNPSDSLKEITLKKNSKLDNYFKDDENAKATYTITLEGDNYTTDLVVTTRSISYRAEATSDSPFTNLDAVLPKLLGQVRKQKTVWGKRGASAIKKKTTIATETKIDEGQED